MRDKIIYAYFKIQQNKKSYKQIQNYLIYHIYFIYILLCNIDKILQQNLNIQKKQQLNLSNMSDTIHTQRQWYEISQVEFGFLYPNQIRKISVCEVDNPSVYDKNTKLPNKNGLYDASLGVAPNDRDSVCPTCGHIGLECSGHPGHIELILPTYNPLIIDTLLKIMKMNCFDCHRFRIKPKIKEDYRIILLLLKKDKIKEAYDYYQINADQQKKRLQKIQKESQSERQKEDHKQKVEVCKRRIETVQKIKQQYTALAQNIQQVPSDSSSASIQLFTQFTKYFNGLCQNKCPYCKKQNKIVKKQGANKIFLITRQSQRKKDLQNSKYRKKSRDSISRGESTMYNTDTNQNTDKNNRQKYISPRQVYNQLKQLWRNQNPLLSILFGNAVISNNYQMFFVKTVFVPPSRFRPQSKLGQQKYLHDHTNMLEKILKNNAELKNMMIQQYLQEICAKQGQKGKKHKQAQLKNIKNLQFTQTSWFPKIIKKFKHKNDFINKWLELQDTVNCFIDSAKSSKLADKDSKGIRQILQRKQGLFRMKMMGKRVNYAARSVISPDPSLNTNEVGVPLFMAKKLTFPQHINEYNLQKLQSFVINGSKYPGANFLQQNGKIVKLDCLTEQQRVSHARNLWNNHQNKILYRHVQTGDNVLFNRQPTLHKAGLMTHKVKVLPKQSTLRMNYANCKSYNADFDGDQMNMHALQTYMAKSQAQLTVSDQMYASPTNGKPLRQIIQDAIIAAVYMTFKDTFFQKKDFSELVYQSTFSLLQNRPANTRLFLVKPAIQKPKQLWTGKQLVSNVIKLVVQFSDLKFKDAKGLCMKAPTKIAKSYMEGYQDQSQVIVWNNQLLKGLIDKAQVGSGSDYGLLHSFNQLYGQKTTGKLMTCLTKLFLNYMQIHGFTCGLDDLLLKKKTNKSRRQAIQQVHQYTVTKVCQQYSASLPQHVNYFGRSQYKCDENGNLIKQNQRIHLSKDQEIVKFLQFKFSTDPQHAGDELDAEYKHHLHQKSSVVIQDSLRGFNKKFPQNNFSMMTVTGAKGSNVNHSQVSVMLGQQQLQGKRVPMMITGKTLPCFIAYDPNPRASGFISDRFLTGLRYQQFYFHCMAGRQGLIDTAVKTSRSGYLQRCLMKHLQSLKVQYDHTVRDSDGGIVQFLYGQDSLNPTKQKFFNKMQFLTNNVSLLKQKFKYNDFKNDLKWKQIDQFKKSKNGKKRTIMQKFHPGKNLGSISQKCYKLLLQNKGSTQFNEIYSLKYKYNMIEPGQAVGCTAAQSIGQPSTQMTLNTFHLAGHGGVNLTLGIPRLRQLLMTSSDKIKTPIMELSFIQKKSKQQALNYARKMNRVKLSQLIKSIEVEEWKQLLTPNKVLLSHQQRKRYYKIKIQFQKDQFIKKQFQLTHGDIQKKIKQSVINALLNYINRVKKKNQLRAEIKRITISQKQKQQKDDQIVDQQDNNQKDNDQKDKLIQQFINHMKQQKQQNNQNQQEDKQKNIKSNQFEALTFIESGCQIIIKVSLNLKKFLMTKVVQKILKDTIMKEINGIKSAIVLQRKGGIPYIQTEGVNFNILQKFSLFDKQSVCTNDIQAMAKKFGIQAARNVLVKQVVSLFGAYGVSVDYRHLYLIGDYVTFGGNIKAMNRNWMKYNASPFLRMTFQTSVKFITDAALRCQTDKCKTPSSKIILGQPPLVGTGICDLLMDSNL